MKIISLIGVPCSGKGTIATIIKSSAPKKHSVAIISTSGLAAKLMNDEAKKKMTDGSFFPLEDLIRGSIDKEVKREIGAGATIVIVDGAPRFLDQLKWFDANFFECDPTYVFMPHLSYDSCRQRAANRARDEYDTDDHKFQLRYTKQLGHINQMDDYLINRNMNRIYLTEFDSFGHDSFSKSVTKQFSHFFRG